MKLEYLYDAKKVGTAAHIWIGMDTACKMLSTGGMRLGKKKLHSETQGKRICKMCLDNYSTMNKLLLKIS